MNTKTCMTSCTYDIIHNTHIIHNTSREPSLPLLNLPLAPHSSTKGDVLGSVTLGRTWIPLEKVSDAFLAKANMGACHLPSPDLTAAFSPADLSSCNLRIPNPCDLSLVFSASVNTRSCSAGVAIVNVNFIRVRITLRLTPTVAMRWTALIND